MEVNVTGFLIKMKTFGIIIAALLLISFKGIAQVDINELPKTNFSLFQKITSESLNEIEDAITIIGKEKIFKITVEDDTDRKDFLVNELKQKFPKVKFLYEVSDSTDFIIWFKNLSLKTNYTNLQTKNILGDEYLNRELTVMYNYAVSGNDRVYKIVSKSYKDEIQVDKLEYVESGNYAFLKSVLPERTFFKKIIIPVVIVALSAIVTILFFTIRSK